MRLKGKMIADMQEKTETSDLERQITNWNQLMDISNVCIAQIRISDMHLMDCNEPMCRLIGYSMQECHDIFDDRMDLFMGSDLQKDYTEFVHQAEQALASHKDTFSMNIRIPTKHGFVWCGGIVSFSAHQEGELPVYMNIVYRDITDMIEAQKKIELAGIELQKASIVQEQMQDMRRMIDGVPTGLGALRIKNHDYHERLQLNRFFYDRIDVRVDQNGTASLEDFISCLHPDDQEQCRADFLSFLETKNLIINQYRFRLRTGSYIWGSVRSIIVNENENREIAYFIYTNINDLKMAEKKLQDDREDYVRTVDAMNIAMWTYDIPNRRITLGTNTATNHLREKFNWPQVFENVPDSILSTVDEEDRPKYLEMIKKVEAGEDASCEVWYQRHDRLEPHCEKESYHVIHDEEGRPILAYGIGQNITAEKKVEERYSREMDYLRHNSDESLIAKGRYNLSKNLVLEYTSSYQNVYSFQPGISYDEAYNGMLDFSYSEDDRRVIADKLNRKNLIRRYQQGQMQTSLQYCRTVEGKTPIWISMTVHTYMMPETGDLELFSYAYDISERKLNEMVMDRVSQAGFDYIGLIHVKNGMFEFLKKTEGIYFSKLREQVPYMDYCNYVRKNFVDPEEQAQYTYSVALENIIEWLKDEPHHASTYRRSENGKVLCKQFDYTWLDERKEAILVTRTDITTAFEREQKQLAIIEAARLEATRANEAKSDFLSSMSHDLRTPLSGVLGFTQLALREKDEQKKQEYLEKIDASGKLLLDLVNDTLELSRIESGKVELEQEAVIANEVIPAVVTALQPAAEMKHVHLNAVYEKDQTMAVWCDKLKVQKIVLNLISNSIKYTPEGGTVSVALKELPAEVNDCNVVLIIEDTGIGMSEEFMKRMYEPFSQEKRSETVKVPGTGLGLSIVKHYVDLMNGRIEVTSRLHQGTHWEVYLPIHEVEAEIKEHIRQSADPVSFAGRKLLLCEDNYLNTEIAVTLLKNQGFEVTAAENGKIGSDLFAASPVGFYDVILMDIRMPVMTGYEAAKRIRSLDRPDAKTVPIIAVTADVFSESIREAKEAGINDYTTKPYEPSKLFDVLQKWITKKK